MTGIDRGRVLALMAGLALTLGVAACGDSNDDGDGDAAARSGSSSVSTAEKEAVTAAVKRMQDGFYSGSATKVCASLTPKARRETAVDSEGKRTSCRTNIGKLVKYFRANNKGERPALVPKVVKVTIEGDKATAMLREGHKDPYPFPLERTAGEWKVNLPLAARLASGEATPDSTPQ